MLKSTRLEIAVLTVASILVIGQMYVVIPLFMPMGEAFGRSATDMVISLSAFGIPYAFAGLVAGPLADAWGAKKVIILSLTATSLTTLAVAFAPGFSGIILLRGVQGISAGFLSAPLFAYIARDIEEDARTFAITTIMAATMSSAILMQLFGQLAAGAFGWRAAFFILAPSILLSMWFADRSLMSSDRHPGNHVLKALLALPGLLGRWRLLALYAAALTLLGGFVAVWSGIELYGPASLRAQPEHLFLLRASALPVMAAVPFLALHLKRIPPHIRIAVGLGMAAISTGGTAFGAVHTSGLAIGLGVCVAGMLVAAPAIVQGVVQTAPDAGGAAVSLYTFSVFLGASLGPRLSVLFAPAGISGLLRATAVFFALGAVLGTVGLKGAKTAG